MKNLPLNGHGLGHVIHFRILTPLYVFVMVKDKNFKYDTHIEHNMCLLSHDKLIPLNGRGRRHVT